MRKSETRKKYLILIIVVVIILTVAILLLNFKRNSSSTKPGDSIQSASTDSGNLDEKIVGDPDTAEVVLYEYADYACSHCATWNQTINGLIEKYPGKIAVIFRGYDLGFKNGPAAAKAATAAQAQGYWEVYKNKLFADQHKWASLSEASLEETLVDYFREVSAGQGDIEQFKADMNSEAVQKRLDYEQKLGESINLTVTPTFRIDGENIPASELVDTIREKIEAKLDPESEL